jgi:hypothetical protein
VERSRRGREGDEEGVAPRVHLDAFVCGEGCAQHAAVLGQRLGVAVCTQLVQELGPRCR